MSLNLVYLFYPLSAYHYTHITWSIYPVETHFRLTVYQYKRRQRLSASPRSDFTVPSLAAIFQLLRKLGTRLRELAPDIPDISQGPRWLNGGRPDSHPILLGTSLPGFSTRMLQPTRPYPDGAADRPRS